MTEYIPLHTENSDIMFSNDGNNSALFLDSLECVTLSNYIYIYLNTYNKQDDYSKKVQQLMLVIRTFNDKTRIVTESYITYSYIVKYNFISALFKYLNIDWLLSTIKGESDNVKQLYLNSIIAPLFRLQSHYTLLKHSIYKNCLELNSVLNDYTELKSFIKDFFHSFNATISLKEMMLLLKYSAPYINDYGCPAQYLFSFISKAVNQSKGVIDLISRDILLHRETTSLLIDAYNMSLELNKKINTSWSLRRLRQINSEWSDELALKDLSKKSKQVLYKDLTVGKGNLCASEKRVFEEGIKMHHCLYVNYWKSIKCFKYLAIHYPSTTEKDGITIGLSINYDKNEPVITFDQAYYKYDKSLTLQDSEEVKDYIKHHLKDFINIIKNSKNNV